jgi:hypothetical protein
VDYLLTPPSATSGEERRGEEAGGEETIIFVCDTSGSMCISEPISDATARRLRGGRTGDLARLRQAGDDANQFLPGERRDVTYVSRMQALQAAVQHQIGELVKNRPNKRVGFVTFATDVTIIGDAAGDTRVLAGSRLNDFATLQAAGEGYKLTRGVKDSSEALVKKIYELSEEGQTALGPAVLVAVGMAAQHPGSKVVIVTDGMANIGCGSLEAPDLPAGATAEAKAAAAETAKQAANTFFTRVANIASTAGVIVDVIGFEGANCNLEALSQLADATSGSMMRVNPANITEQFSNILEDEVVATNASVTMTSHAGLFIRDPAQDAIMEDAAVAPRVATPATTVGMLRSKYAMQAGKVAGNVYDAPLSPIAEAESEAPAACPPPRIPFMPTASSVTMYIGNVTSSSEVTFEYGQKHGSELPAALRKELSELKRIPFQVQISYTRPDGALCLRVITSALEITTEVRRAESNIQASPMVSHAARTTAAYAKGGRYQSSSVVAAQYQNLLARNVDGMDADSRGVYAAWNDETTELRSVLDAEVGKDRAMKRARATPAVGAPVSSIVSAPASFARSIANSVSSLFRSSEAPKEDAAPVAQTALAAPMAAPMAPGAAMPALRDAMPALREDSVDAGDASEDEDADDDRLARVSRRATDDALAARIHGMGKGGKNYTKKSSY